MNLVSKNDLDKKCYELLPEFLKMSKNSESINIEKLIEVFLKGDVIENLNSQNSNIEVINKWKRCLKDRFDLDKSVFLPKKLNATVNKNKYI